ncbi:hypothetical protein OF83DRAFT_1068318 [Amylostereum chailletii]|nr:hypothetical protein OF83DRAFT_1068318 [Amylostereum chailletii]
MSLTRLPSPTRAKLRSTQILTSLPQAISELVQNSLDASASNIEIGVDCEGWECWVRDNGEGIGRDGLASLASGRYNTSKAYAPASLENVSTFGFRGEALASAADISCLEIASRTARSRESRTIVLKDGKCLYEGPSTRWRRERAGTVVCLRDIFYNLPIRRTSHTGPAKTLELIRKDIEMYALMFPRVAFALEDVVKSRDGGYEKGRLLAIPKTSSTLAAFRHIHGKALAEHVDEFELSEGEMTVSGFISLNGALSKVHQYLYVNRHPLSPCHLHRLIDSQFARSSFAKHALDQSGEANLLVSRRSPRKAEHKPVYVINISLHVGSVDNYLEPAKAAVHLLNDEAVASSLTSVVRSFLLRHGFLSEVSDASPSPRKKRKVHHEREESGFLPTITEPHETYTSQSQRNHQEPLHVIPVRCFIRTPDPQQAEIEWTDPQTGVSYIIDTRTGNSYQRDAQRYIEERDGEEAPSSGPSRRTLVDTRWLRKAKDPSNTGPPPQWLVNALQVNGAYRSLEPAVPTVSQPHTPGGDGCIHAHPYASGDVSSVSSRFQRADLLRAHVLGQVDRKFIACTLDKDDGARVLVVVDQHAASERVRVERFLSGLCTGYLGDGAQRVDVRPVRAVMLTEAEVGRLWEGGAGEVLKRWGFGLVRVEGEEDVGKVLVSHVPEVVSEKLLVGEELRDLLKSFLATWEMEDMPPMTQTQKSPGAHVNDEREESDEAFRWQKALRWCPRALIELVNSRACRGAIMFNDSLTQDQCERLLAQLACTAFPFQCAHGRPSLVPLASVASNAGARRGRRGGKVLWERLKWGKGGGHRTS